MEIIKGKVICPWKIMIYGNPGIGKTYWAAKAPAPLILDFEGGANQYSVDKTPIIKSLDQFREAIKLAMNTDHKTIVLDTADALDSMLTLHICKEGDKNGAKKSLAKFGFGEGYKALDDLWKNIMESLEMLNIKGKNIIIIAHAHIKAFNNPMVESYDQYKPKINKDAIDLLTGKMDALFFIQQQN